MDDLEDLRSRLACVAEATYWDRPYDTRIAAIRGMCDLSTNGMTPIEVGEYDVRRRAQIHQLAETLAGELEQMDRDTAIDLTRWPTAARLVDLVRPAVAPKAGA